MKSFKEFLNEQKELEEAKNVNRLRIDKGDADDAGNILKELGIEFSEEKHKNNNYVYIKLSTDTDWRDAKGGLTHKLDGDVVSE